MPRPSSKRRHRSESLEQLSARLNFKFDATYPYKMHTLLGDFKLFKRGHSRSIQNMLYWADDFRETEFRIFDYSFVIHQNNKRVTREQTVFFAKSRKLNLPQILLRPENLLDKIASLLGIRDIDFETHPDFSRNYLLKGDDAEWIRQVFSNEILMFFTKEKDWHVEALNYFLIVYKENKVISPVELEKKHIPKSKIIYELLLNYDQMK